LFDAFLNPAAFNDGGTAGPLTANQAVGSIVRGLSQQVGNELDEFVTSSVRNRSSVCRSTCRRSTSRAAKRGIPSLNSARRQFYNATLNSAVSALRELVEFGLNLKHKESLTNFIAAYGKGANAGALNPRRRSRRSAARQTSLLLNNLFMFEPAATSGLDDVDYWVGGLAERQAAFGGLLGTTFNFVFEKQLDNLQNGDRFYYLNRLDGLNLRSQIEDNTLAELARRNSDVGGVMANVFETADHNFEMATLVGTAPLNFVDGSQILDACRWDEALLRPSAQGLT